MIRVQGFEFWIIVVLKVNCYSNHCHYLVAVMRKNYHCGGKARLQIVVPDRAGYAPVCASMRGYARACAGMRGYARVCASMRGYS